MNQCWCCANAYDDNPRLYVRIGSMGDSVQRPFSVNVCPNCAAEIKRYVNMLQAWHWRNETHSANR